MLHLVLANLSINKIKSRLNFVTNQVFKIDLHVLGSNTTKPYCSGQIMPMLRFSKWV